MPPLLSELSKNERKSLEIRKSLETRIIRNMVACHPRLQSNVEIAQALGEPAALIDKAMLSMTQRGILE